MEHIDVGAKGVHPNVPSSDPGSFRDTENWENVLQKEAEGEVQNNGNM